MLLKYSWLMFQMLMNVLLEEFPALDLGSVSTLLGVISASAIKASTSCTLEANTSVMVRSPSLCFSLFLPLVWKGFLIVLKTEMPGVGAGGGQALELNKQESSSTPSTSGRSGTFFLWFISQFYRDLHIAENCF